MSGDGGGGGRDPVVGVEETIHARVRLGVRTILVAEGPRDFVTLRQSLRVSDGNLATHLRVLEDAGYCVVRKEFVGRRPRTTYAATPKGRTALAEYARAMQRLLAGLTPEGDP